MFYPHPQSTLARGIVKVIEFKQCGFSTHCEKASRVPTLRLGKGWEGRLQSDSTCENMPAVEQSILLKLRLHNRTFLQPAD